MSHFYFPSFTYKTQHYENGKNAIVRIQRLEIFNFKGVSHGEIEFNNYKSLGESFNSSNILGLYGQNGSGKSTLIEALYVLKILLSGKSLPNVTADFISQDSRGARMHVTFEKTFLGSDEVELITYQFALSRRSKGSLNEYKTSLVEVFDEQIYSSIRSNTGKLLKKTHKLYDSYSNNSNMNGSSKMVYARKLNESTQNEYEYECDNWLEDLTEAQKYAVGDGCSALFYNGGPASIGSPNFDCPIDAWEWDDDVVSDTEHPTLRLLQEFGKYKLYIAGANLFHAYENNEAPVYFQSGYLSEPFYSRDDDIDDEIECINDNVSRLNTVLECVIPGLNLVADIHKAKNRKKQNDFWEPVLPLYKVDLYTERNGVKIPLNQESEGIKRLVYSMDLLIAAYTDPSVTVAIDEFDAGIFEYLLGELLQIFETSGCGQLIFTSHNLRPLEVISRKFICFTTTNPENRYIRLKYIGKTNNLRDVYFRQILVGEQDEEIYNKTKHYKLVEAFDKAGEE